MKFPSHHILAFALLSALSACSLSPSSPEPSPDPDGVSVDAIIGGTPASEYPEAGFLNMPLGNGRVGLCSATLISPKTVLTAGHCVDGFSKWEFYLGSVMRSSTRGETYDWNEGDSSTVNPLHQDIGLVHLDSPINIPNYPTLAVNKVPNGSQALNVGRVLNGVVSNSLWNAPATLFDATPIGYPYDYYAPVVIQHGDSGGPVFLTNTHTLVAVNSGANDSIEVLARVDLLASWIFRRIALNEAATGGSSTDAGTSADSGTADSATPPADSGASPSSDGGAFTAPPCLNEVEPNNSLSEASSLATSNCGLLATGTDVDWYRFTANVGVTQLRLNPSSDATFTIGVLSTSFRRPVCLPLGTSLQAASITVKGSPRELCLRVSSPSQQRQVYRLTR